MRSVSWFGASLVGVLSCSPASHASEDIAAQPLQEKAPDSVQVIPAPLPDVVAPPSPEATPQPEAPKSSEPEPIQSQVLNALTNSTTRYPFLVHPTGRAAQFHPHKSGNQTQVNFKREAQQITIQDASHQYFPTERQLYWVLPGNRIAIETEGWQGEIKYQGRELNTTIEQRMKATQALWGLQAAWILPESLQELIGEETLETTNVVSVAAETTNLPGMVAPSVLINTSDLFTKRSDRAIQTISPPRTGTGSTNNPAGGGNLFELLEAENTPKILQAFPTHNLQALLSGEGLFEGAKLTKGVLAQAGILFGNPLTGKGFEFKPEMTSVPGIKIAQATRFDNRDLLNVLVNPFLDQKQRDLYYLNSLNWVSLGLRPPKILDTAIADRSKDWYALRLNRPHNRALLQYEKTPGQATYYNVFSNPGIAVSMSFDKNAVNLNQSANSTLGLLMGSAFEFMRPYRLEKSLWEARLRYGREESFTPLRTQTTSEQRKQINQRLNQTLNFAARASGLEQVSGIFTVPSRIAPTRSQMFQFRAGTHSRRVRFSQVDQTWVEGESYISKLRLSNTTFGPLTLIGTAIPRTQTSLVLNRNAAVQTFITRSDGQTFQFTSDADLTVVPMQIRAFDTAFDRIELSQIGQVVTQINGFDGYLHLPSVEALWTGTQGNLSYSLTAGVWGNLNSKRVPGWTSQALDEPTLGSYAKAALSWMSRRVKTGSDQQVRAIATQIPAVQLAWNSAANSSNPAYCTLSHSYLRQTKQVNLALTAGMLLSYSDRGFAPLGFARSQIGLKTGSELTAAVELGDYLFYSLEAMQSLSPRWSLGAYGQNYQTTSGMKNRAAGKAYGMIIQHRLPKGGAAVQTRIGMNGDHFEIQLEGSLNF